jgi:hypothetical protein
LNPERCQRNFAEINLMLAEIIPASHSPGWWIAATTIAIIALYLFIKIEHFLLRMLAGGIGLAAIAGVVWWLLFRH